MTTLEKIKSKVVYIDIEELIKRLKLELKIKEIIIENSNGEEGNESEENTTITTENETAIQLLEYAIYDTLLIVLDVTHLKKIDESLYSIWVNMIKDYWFLNKYDEIIKESTSEDDDALIDNSEVSSVKLGDTTVDFSSKSNTININGTRYSTGTIKFDENILREKYKKDLYRHRKLRWS